MPDRRRPLVASPAAAAARARGEDPTMPANLSPEERRAAADPGLPAPPRPVVKPGYKSTEFWLTFLFGLLLFVGTFVMDHSGALGLPGVWGVVAALAFKVVGAPAIAWLTVRYADGRAKIKAGEVLASATTVPPAPAP